MSAGIRHTGKLDLRRSIELKDTTAAGFGTKPT